MSWLLQLPAIYFVILFITLLALIFGAILGFASIKLKVKSDPIIDRIDAILPQSQCGQCGYPGCRPYAKAVANGEKITKCVPGGQPLIEKLADLLGIEAPQGDFEETPVDKVAIIDESMCIGCTKCIQACPVDAIIGANKAIHTVIPELCTGCELCIPPCPTDCITMKLVSQTLNQWNWKFNPDLIIPIVEKQPTSLQRREND
ncbi:electron transport complex subunit RsxB [Mergibacter septicus]|uniref:electron transport complex subunit RsxB n=1 Tax=Mergibacter septicus TaxID=221402 RepID=UPI0011792B39|nr:electron transport complex subunit RsxB [Mergibacter septicus]AWX13428.1 electron transport complex subunit RsxB [Mergibacter septicus]